MKLIITAGGTAEKIDPVRKITNMATGRLGCRIAEEFAAQAGDAIETIYYIGEKEAAAPSLPCLTRIRTEGAENVRDVLSRLLSREKIDAVVHSMAVSDYTVGTVTTMESLAGFLADKLAKAGPEVLSRRETLAGQIAGWMRQNDRTIPGGAKIGSGFPNLLLAMRQTPKLIGLIKALQPSTVLVGFKLLSGVTRRELLDAGYGVMRKNACDLVLANDLTGIDENRHIGLLLQPDGTYTELTTKEAIAREIARQVLCRIERRQAVSTVSLSDSPE